VKTIVSHERMTAGETFITLPEESTFSLLSMTKTAFSFCLCVILGPLLRWSVRLYSSSPVITDIASFLLFAPQGDFTRRSSPHLSS